MLKGEQGQLCLHNKNFLNSNNQKQFTTNRKPMKVLKIIGIVILILILIVAIGSFVTPTKVDYEKSISIDASVELVWDKVNSMEDLNSWSPWVTKDPNMKQELTGEAGTVGEMHSWESEVEEVGRGSQTISNLEAPNLVETDLKFYDPYESEAKAYVKLEADGDGTKATWGFSSDMPRPFNLMMLMTDMEEMIGADYQQGLDNLKSISEEAQAEAERQMLIMESDTTATDAAME